MCSLGLRKNQETRVAKESEFMKESRREAKRCAGSQGWGMWCIGGRIFTFAIVTWEVMGSFE